MSAIDFIHGLFAAGNSDINFLSLNGADNGLHLVSAVVAAGFCALVALRRRRSRPNRDRLPGVAAGSP